MAYKFLVKTPTIIRLPQKVYNLRLVGEIVTFSDDVGRLIQQNKIPGSEHLQLTVIEPPLTPPSVVSEPIVESVAEPLEPTVEIIPEPLPEPVGEPIPESEQPEVEVVSQPEVKPELPIVPLPDDAHWSTVKALLLDMEEEGHLDMVEAIQRKYPQFKSVQEEAARILNQTKAE